MKTAKLITCDNSIKANLIKNRLENEGIHAFLINENFTSLMPNFYGMLGAGVQVVVNRKDYEKSLIVIQDELKPKKEIICPNCHSKNIEINLGTKRWNKFVIMLLSILAFLPFNNIKTNYHCKDCGNDF